VAYWYSECGAKLTTHDYRSKTDENGNKTYKNSYRCKNKNYLNKTISCNAPDITHAKVEKAFVEYIEKVTMFSEIENVEWNNTEEAKHDEQSKLKLMTDCEEKINSFEKRKKQILEKYVSEEITFAEYKDMVKVLDENINAVGKELSTLKKETEKPENHEDLISQEDIMLDLKENWKYLNNAERLMFLQNFIKKIVIKVEKENHMLSIVKICNIEFN
jgi:hypothetical protein